MTENEAIKCLRKQIEVQPCGNVALAFEKAIQALFEIQQYRAIGTIEEFKAYKLGDCMNKCEHYDNCANYIYTKGYNKAIDEFAERLKSDEFQKYNLDMVFETSRDLSYSHCINAFCEYIDEIAEELKGGAE